MNAEVRAQLQSLKIDRDQRPAAAPARVRSGDRPRARGGRWVVLLILLGGAAGAGYWQRDRLRSVGERVGSGVASSLSQASEPDPVPLLTVSAEAMRGPGAVLTATGKIVSDHKVAVATKVSGQIVALHFEQGDYVKQGQMLAEIEDVIYRARRDQAQAQLLKAQATLEYQKVNFGRVQALAERGDAPEIEFADAQRWVNEAAAQVAADRAALEFTQKQLSDCRVVAPIDGVILERNVEVGDFVAAEGGRGANANAQFAAIADMSKLRVEVDISELDIDRIRKDMPCTIAPDAYKDRQFSGFVMWIDPGANFSKATVQVKVRINEPDRRYLRVEGSAKVVFLEKAERAATAEEQAEEQAGIWIPARACLADGTAGTGAVFVVADGRLKRTAVRLGQRRPDRVQVLDGLTDGQQIAADGVERLSDGQRVAKPK